MDAPCKIQGSIHVFRLVNNMCPGKWVHIKILRSLFILLFIFYNYLTVYVVPRPIPCFLKKPEFTNLLTICNTFVFPNPVYSTNFLEGKALNCRISYIFFSSVVNLSKFCSMTGKMILIEFSEYTIS